MDWKLKLLEDALADIKRLNSFIEEEANFKFLLMERIQQQSLTIEALTDKIQQLETIIAEKDELLKDKEEHVTVEDIKEAALNTEPLVK